MGYRGKQKDDVLKDIMDLLGKSHVVIPKGSKMYLSHHYGMGRFRLFGAAVIECFNERGYAKKVLVVLPDQYHEEHYHKEKHETFHVLYGELRLIRGPFHDVFAEVLTEGDYRVVAPMIKHSFSSATGCVFEEISTHQHEGDSVYTEAIDENRKTLVKEF